MARFLDIPNPYERRHAESFVPFRDVFPPEWDSKWAGPALLTSIVVGWSARTSATCSMPVPVA